MSWDTHLNIYGLSGNPPVGQDTPLNIATSYSGGAVSATAVAGTVTQRLVVGTAADANNAVYIDSQGIYAGNSVFAQAPFNVNMQGVLNATKANITGSITSGKDPGRHIFIDGTTGVIKIFDQANTLVGVIFGDTGQFLLSSDIVPTAGGINIDPFNTTINSPDTGDIVLVARDTGGGLTNTTVTTTADTTFDHPISVTGGITASTGDIISTLGDITSSAGTVTGVDVTATTTVEGANVSATGSYQATAQIVSGSPTISPSDGSIIAYTGTTGGTVTLPDAGAFGVPYIMYFKDEGNNSGTNPILLSAQAGQTIEFSSTFNVNVSGSGLTMYADGATAWYIVGLA